jgi:hypothetical protein
MIGMAEITIEQALYRRESSNPPRLLARSPGFDDSWLGDSEWLVLGFGDPPPWMSWPSAVYAQPLGKEHVAIVQVAARGKPSQTLTLDFHLLILPREAYVEFFGDPFEVARRLPPPWDAREPLPSRTLPAEPLPPRTVQEIQQILKRTKAAALSEDRDPPAEDQDLTIDNAKSPALLGGAQVLVDGGRVVFERPDPDPELMQGLWKLLPTSTRCQLWPASFALSNALNFDAVVTPRARAEEFSGYTGEEQAAHYPDGHYERRLQAAAEAGDQQELDALFGRRSAQQTIRLATTILAVLCVVVLALKIFDRGPPPRPVPPEQVRKQVAVVAGLIGSANPLNAAGMLAFAQKSYNLADASTDQPTSH